jgi:hypothetical protein
MSDIRLRLGGWSITDVSDPSFELAARKLRYEPDTMTEGERLHIADAIADLVYLFVTCPDTGTAVAKLRVIRRATTDAIAARDRALAAERARKVKP